MAFFDRFNKKRTASVLPSEVDEYYRSEKRGRRGAAFLLGLMTLILTVLIVLALFFVGRFFYHKIKGDSNKADTSSITSESDKKKNADKKSSDDKNGSSTSENGSSSSTATGSNTGNSSSSTPISQPAPTQAVAPNTGDSVPTTSLPRTGDEGM